MTNKTKNILIMFLLLIIACLIWVILSLGCGPNCKREIKNKVIPKIQKTITEKEEFQVAN